MDPPVAAYNVHPIVSGRGGILGSRSRPALVVATSQDGIHFTKYPGNTILSLKWRPVRTIPLENITSAFARQVGRFEKKWFWSLFYIAAIFLLLFFNFRETNRLIHSFAEIEHKKVSEEIGEIVNHSQRTVYIASYYGWPLEYYAELTGTYWPRSTSDVDLVLDRNNTLSVEGRLERLGFFPEYWVITNFAEYARYHQDLEAYLVQNCSILAETDQYLIYHSCAQ